MIKGVILRSRQHNSLLQEIDEKVTEDTAEVHLCTMPSTNTLVLIFMAVPDIERGTCPPSLFDKTSKKIKDALDELNVSFEPASLEAGRPLKHGRWKIEKICDLAGGGATTKEISEELDIPPTTIHYHLRKGK